MLRNSIISFVVLAGVLLVSLWYVYANYHQEIYDWLGVRVQYTMFISEVFFSVTVADEPAEWRRGLSNTAPLVDQTGMLFVFDTSDRYGMWMKDMRYALDMIWIDENFTVVHIEENVTPDTYPTTFSSPVPARFVLEVPAFTVESFKIQVGQQASIPVDVLPDDLQPI
ncbi:hypothetical protein CL655_00975 [bacterium]|nr:hypothetical protein [bacterium]|tara:strand:+ start:592 stop:1095 length:504 start_codon:yes stop_codon:yes gene_type:complete